MVAIVLSYDLVNKSFMMVFGVEVIWREVIFHNCRERERIKYGTTNYKLI